MLGKILAIAAVVAAIACSQGAGVRATTACGQHRAEQAGAAGSEERRPGPVRLGRRGVAVELAQAVRDAMRRADQHQRTTSICTQRVDGAKQRIREVENRIAELAELQAGYAAQQAAPQVRNMLRPRIPGPHRLPG